MADVMAGTGMERPPVEVSGHRGPLHAPSPAAMVWPWATTGRSWSRSSFDPSEGNRSARLMPGARGIPTSRAGSGPALAGSSPPFHGRL